MKIAVIGTGYVGLVTGTCLSEYGNKVYCIDIVKEKIDQLRQGKIPIYEPGLEEMVKHNLERDLLHFTTDLAEAINQAEIIFLTLGTPNDGQGNADMTAILEVSKEIGKSVNSYQVIVIKSTVPVGSADRVREAVAEFSQSDFDVVSNPEFLRQGHAVEDFMQPERIIIGSDNPRSTAKLKQLYHPFAKNSVPILFMNTRSSELVKYACNSFLALKISFANEMANLCDAMGANYNELREGLGLDRRIGKQFLATGIGYGGSCLPKDVRALVKTAEEYKYKSVLLEEIENINQRQKNRFINTIQEHLQTKNFNSYTFAIWGLAFKPNTDDVRDAPSLGVIEELLARGASLQVNDPAAHGTARKILGDRVSYLPMYDALEGADALILLTEWPIYQEPDFGYIKKALKQAIIFDGRNVYDADFLRKNHFTYYGIGINSLQ